MYNQSELNQINDTVCDNIQLLVDDLGLTVLYKNDKLVGPCEAHSSDNSHSFQMYLTGHTRKGNWFCATNHCENKYYSNVIGYCRGVLSNRYGCDYPFTKVVGYLRTLYGINQLTGETKSDAEKKGGPPLYWLKEYWREEMPICVPAKNTCRSLLFQPITS